MNLKNVISLLGIMLITTLGLYYLPWADDFCSIVKSQTSSPWQYALDYYNNWDGRIFNYLIQAIMSRSFEVLKYSVFVWILFFFFMVYFVQKTIARNSSFYFYFFLSTLFWIGFRRHISETVYWSTGGGYIMATFLGLAWIYFHDQKTIQTKSELLIWSLFSFLAGINSFSLSPALITYITWEKLVIWYQKKDLNVFRDKKFILSLIFLLLGTIIMISAPGNFLRASHSQEAFGGFILWNLARVNLKFIAFGWQLIILSAIIAYIFRDLIISTTTSKKLQWLLTAVATASPLAALNSFTSPRTAVFFHAFFSIFLLLSFKSLFEKVSARKSIRTGLEFVLIITFFGLILTDHLKGYQYFKEYSAQFEVLRKNQGSQEDVVFTKQPSPPKSLDAELFKEDPSYFGNVCAANYYGVKKIIYKPND